jgi:hypothetical protein
VAAWLAAGCQLAALAMIRYVVAALVGGTVLAGLCVAANRSRAYQWLLSSILVLGVLGSGGMVTQWWEDGRFIGDRNEPWPALLQYLDREWNEKPGPVFLAPGLLEDLTLLNRRDPRLEAYCLFPLNGIYQCAARDVVPLPTSPRLHVTLDQCRRIEQAGGCWLIVRAGSVTTERIAERFQSQLSRQGVAVELTERARWGNLALLGWRVVHSPK